MSNLGDDLSLVSSTKEDFLIREIILTHDPSDCRLDSKLLFLMVENTLCSTMAELHQLPGAHVGAINIRDIDVVRWEEPLGHTINKISHEIIDRCFEDVNSHAKAMVLFEMLRPFGWDAKVALVLAAVGSSYSTFQLILQQQSDNPLAAYLAILKQLPADTSSLERDFTALKLLINTMMKVTKIIIKLEGLYQQLVLLDNRAMIAKSKIYIASYWLFRSALACSSQIAGLRTPRDLHSTIVAAWVLHSLENKLSSLCCDLEELEDLCHKQIETRLHEKLVNAFKESGDNQEFLGMLFGSKNESPFKDSTQKKASSAAVLEQYGILELENKVVILLITKPELLPIDKLFFLVQRIYDHPHHKEIEGSYEILWVPIPFPQEWDPTDKIGFELLSQLLPWLSIRQPWSLNPALINFIRNEWNFKEEPQMLVLDVNGTITNFNATDMVWIWGAKAFPFSTLRERELWEQENWTLRLLIDGIDPLLTNLVNDGKNICIYGSSNLGWIKEFTSWIKKIKGIGIQLEVIYVGWRNPSNDAQIILDIIDQEKLNASLTFTKMCFFWSRLDSINRSISQQESSAHRDRIADQVSRLLDIDNYENGWAVIGQGSSLDVIQLEGKKLNECFSPLPAWLENVEAMGLVGAIRRALESLDPGKHCIQTELLPYEDGSVARKWICSKCKRQMESFVVYQCTE